MKELKEANRAVLLGRGVKEIGEEGEVRYQLSPASEMRVGAMVRYFNGHRQAFESRSSVIVASGGYARLAAGQVAPPLSEREGSKIADRLVQCGIPHWLVEKEIESGSTTENYEEIIKEGFFAGTYFDADDPLLVVASRPHGERRGVPLARAGFGIEDVAGVGLLVAEPESVGTRIREYVGGLATIKAIAEMQPEPFNAADMAAVGERFEYHIAHPVTLVQPGITHIVAATQQAFTHSQSETLLAA